MTSALSNSYAWCKSLSRRTADNFYFSFWTLPGDKFRDMCVLYAFMRVSDDMSDDQSVPVPERILRLAAWRESLARALDGRGFDHPLFPALADLVGRYQIPRDYLFSVIDGIEADLYPQGFETFDDLSVYCYRVAGVVGLCCIHVWGFHDERAVEAAVECGLAFQLTNILRDLGEDADMGRVYLPRGELQRFAYSADDLAGHVRDERFTRLMRFQVERAHEYYRRAEKLFDYLDPPGKPIFSAMLNIYHRVLGEIERRGYDVFSERVRLSPWRKIAISLGALAKHRFFAWAPRSQPPEPAAPSLEAMKKRP